MKWINANDIKHWANTRDCQETLPLLIRKLIWATNSTITEITFPSGDNITVAGWDGILQVEEGNAFIPSGRSLWEIGTNKDVKSKADTDYEKRTENSLGYNIKDCTYVFVTSQLWQNANDWVIEKKEEKKWKEIRVINSVFLEEWLEQAPAVASWLACRLGKYTGDVLSAEIFWEQWATGLKFNLIPEIILAGRKQVVEKIKEKLDIPSLIPIKGSSREEVIAFMVAMLKKAENKENILSRVIIIENIESFRKVTFLQSPHILIPRFEDSGAFNLAIQKKHTVLIPLGADANVNYEGEIVLPKLGREEFIEALLLCGITREFAEKYSKESARNINVFRRQLQFDRTLPIWSTPKNVTDLVPALLLGRWDEIVEGDRMLMAEIAGVSYDSYIHKITKWLKVPDAPIIKIGSKWRLTSPFDAWSHASTHITSGDFEMLNQAFMEVLSEINPAFELEPSKRFMANVLGKSRKYSGWLREGIMQSLTLTAIYGDNLDFNTPISSQSWVDQLVAEFLKTKDANNWKSFERLLPWIAEASPTSFLKAIENLLQEQLVFKELFTEEPGILMNQTYYTGLLWALEALAWHPSYFLRAVLILVNLCTIDPGGSLSNRPENTLFYIFLPWNYQTLAVFNDRMEVLGQIIIREQDIAWNLLIHLLPGSDSRIGHYTNRTRWRGFQEETQKAVTYKEIYETHDFILSKLLSSFPMNETRLIDLVNASEELAASDRDKVLQFINLQVETVECSQHNLWSTLRHIIFKHRSYYYTKWALKTETVEKYQQIYDKLIPKDILDQTIWLFEKYTIELPEGNFDEEDKLEKYRHKIKNLRQSSLSKMYTKYGIEKVIALIAKVQEQGILGEILANVLHNRFEIKQLIIYCNSLQGDQLFMKGFLYQKCQMYGIKWIMELYQSFEPQALTDDFWGKSFALLPQDTVTWDFLKTTNSGINDAYWTHFYPNFYSANVEILSEGIQKLMQYKRHFSALELIRHNRERLPSQIIVEILEITATIKADEKGSISDYEICQIFKELDKKADVSNEKMVTLEWYYIDYLTEHHAERRPIHLLKELSEKPEFFIDLIKILYIPEKDSGTQQEESELSEKKRAIMAKNADNLLNTWESMPGMTESFNLDKEMLENWIDEVRQLGKQCNRLGSVDNKIGEMLSNYPQDMEVCWPPIVICEILERINSKRMNIGFEIGTYNTGGVTVRGAFDRGEIEKNKSRKYRKYRECYQNRFIVITQILENLEKTYLADAKFVDESATRDELDC